MSDLDSSLHSSDLELDLDVDNLDLDLDLDAYEDEESAIAAVLAAASFTDDESSSFLPQGAAAAAGHSSAGASRGSLSRAERERLFATSSCKNVVWVAAFVCLCVVAVVFVAVDLHESGARSLRLHVETVFVMMVCCFVACAAGVASLCVWVWVSRPLLWLLQFTSVAFCGFLGVLLLSLERGAWQAGVAFLLLALGMVVWMIDAARNRSSNLHFATVLLDMISDLIKQNPALITVCACVLLAQTCWLALFSMAAYQSTKFQHYGFFYVFLIAAFYWTTQVFKHVVHVVTSGTMAHWYFRLVADTDEARAGVSITCVRRALTTDFGAICFGSFFVSIVHTAWVLLRRCVESATVERVGARCLVQRPYELVSQLYRSFNKYAFLQVVMYNKDFCDASRETWRKFADRGIDSIIAEDKLETLLFFPAIGGGCFVACVAGIWAYQSDSIWHNWSAVAIAMFCVGVATVMLTTEVVESTSTTLMACFADEPANLHDANSLIFNRFVRISEFSAYRQGKLEDEL